MKNITYTIFILLFVGCGGGGGGSSGVVSQAIPASSSKAITSFNLAGVPATINEQNKSISVILPSGTYVNALVATFTQTGSNISVLSTSQVSGVTLNDFNDPIIYTVTADNGSVASYIVTVSGGIVTTGSALIRSFNSTQCTLTSPGNYNLCGPASISDFELTIGTCHISKRNTAVTLTKGASSLGGQLDNSSLSKISTDGVTSLGLNVGSSTVGVNLAATTASLSANGLYANPVTYALISITCP